MNKPLERAARDLLRRVEVASVNTGLRIDVSEIRQELAKLDKRPSYDELMAEANRIHATFSAAADTCSYSLMFSAAEQSDNLIGKLLNAVKGE